jgi:hypothetical protein
MVAGVSANPFRLLVQHIMREIMPARQWLFGADFEDPEP